jgi:hypothetical protein
MKPASLAETRVAGCRGDMVAGESHILAPCHPDTLTSSVSAFTSLMSLAGR